jgi:hypothetical protein
MARSSSPAPVAPPVDVEVENHGSILLVRPLTPVAQDWIAENVGGDPQWWAGAIACEPRYVDDLVAGMADAGLVVA